MRGIKLLYSFIDRADKHLQELWKPTSKSSDFHHEKLQAIPGVPKIKDKYNPGTWMMEVSYIGAKHGLGIEFAELYKNSSLNK